MFPRAAALRPPQSALWALALPALLAAAHVGVFYYIALSRVRYPFELEWMEGGVLSMVERVRAGLPLYVEPSVEFVPFIYTPLFYYAAAALSVFSGVDFTTLRIVSIVCTTILFALVGLRVWRETKNPAAGILGAGFLAAAFVPTGQWFDLGRVDMLCLALVYGGFLLARCRAGLGGAAGAGVLLGLALLAKQSALWPAGGLGLGLLLSSPKRAFAFGAGFLVAGLLPCFLADWRSDGWFFFYTVDCPRSHELDPAQYVQFWTIDLWSAAPVLCLLAVPGLALLVRASRREGSARLELCFFAALVASSWASRLHVGGWFNVNIPAFLALSVLAARGLASLAERASRASARRVAALGLAGLALAPALHFVSAWPHPSRCIPGPADLRDAERIVQLLREAPGPVFVMGNPYLAERAGKAGNAHGIALIDVLRTGKRPPLEDPLMQDLLQRLEERRYALFLTHSPWPMIEAWYANTETLDFEGDCFMPATAPAGRPRFVYRPKPIPAPAGE